jgi:hypothetical protein
LTGQGLEHEHESALRIVNSAVFALSKHDVHQQIRVPDLLVKYAIL